MRGLFLYVSARHLRHTPLRTLLVGSSLMLGVALLVCIRAAGQNAERALIGAVEHTVGRAQLQILALSETGMPESLTEDVRHVAGVAQAVPVIDVQAHMAERPGQTLFIMGLDLLDAATVGFYEAVVEGDVAEDPLVFLAQADSVVVGEEFARRNNLSWGSSLRLVTVQGKQEFVVRGLLRAGGLGGALGGDIGFMDIYAAQRAFGKEGRIDHIDLRLTEDADLAATAAALRQAVEGVAAVEPPQTRGATVEQMLLSFRLMTAFLGIIAPFAACFLVFSMTSIAVAQRRREIAVLRAVGATRRQVVGLFIGEAAAIGGLASLMGVVVGTWMARGLAQAFARLFEASFRVQIDAGVPSFPLEALLLPFLVGTGAAIAASLLATRDAARPPIIAALKDLPAAGPERQRKRQRLALAASLALLSVTAVLVQRRSGIFLVGGTADALVVLAAFLAAPYLIVALAPRLIRPGLALFGTPALLALRNFARQRDRLAAPVTILTMALYLVITVGAITASFESSVLTWVEQAGGVDLGVVAAGSYTSVTSAPMNKAFGDQLRAVHGVARVRPFRVNRVRFRGVEVQVQPWAHEVPPTLEDIERFTFVQGAAAAAVTRLPAGAFALVSENLAVRFHLGVGDTLELPTPQGPVHFEIVGVVLDYSSTAGTVVVNRDLYERLWRDTIVDAFEIAVAPGISEDWVREQLHERFDVTVFTVGERLKETRDLLRGAFFPLRAVEIVVLSVGLLSLLNALLVSVVERFRELGILRASGASTGQLVGMILLEALATSSIAAVLGITLGVYGSNSWIRVHLPVATGWIVHYTFPWGTLFSVVVAALALAAAAGAYPARLAARMPIVDAIKVE